MNNHSYQILSNIKTIALAIVLIPLATSCFEESEYEKQQKESDLQIKTYLQDNNIEAKQADNGIFYEMISSNESGTKPKLGEVVMVKYEMSTLDGKVLESFSSDSSLVKFSNNSVIPVGFNYGIDIMRKGESIRVYIPSYLAYDSFSSKDEFGPNTNFILEIKLIDITTDQQVYQNQIDQIEEYLIEEDLGEITPTTSGLYYKQVSPGEGTEAKAYHTATLHYTRKYLDGTVIQKTEDDAPLVVNLSTNQLVEGFREGVLKMKAGEKALLIMPADIAFGASVKIIPSTVREELYEEGYIFSLVDAYQIVQYEVELLKLK
ncbi:FKBP-type peptidyl-prolyl cis-trans isomerase [Reichenbachiella faecimaris]|uniref:Peptidyl-prolyl cis-trans isomerase n=1 Tax=Reichenbachiella faecimaris TaxID=692418 RepID=A0A1W2GM27_REIFA|nr:FKBP-type peptidyl-prolyl cis-trans isomerase [Reichenbachiella faecimaris]SMD37719.1 FKBP-type peptidyl-prolyl cis-trans isomerase [Reichenbachiella faecimaris]